MDGFKRASEDVIAPERGSMAQTNQSVEKN